MILTGLVCQSFQNRLITDQARWYDDVLLIYEAKILKVWTLQIFIALLLSLLISC